MARTPEIFSAVVVALGSFNPPIFTPDWFLRNNLIGSEDAESATGSSELVIVKQFAHVETGWFDLQVVEGRLTLSSKDVLRPSIKDLAVGMFSLLPHIPISAIGINFVAHYAIENEANYHKVGDTLAPKGIWESLLTGKDESAGLFNLQITISPEKRGVAPKTTNRKQITVQPSAKIKQGVYFNYNEHYEIVVPPDSKSSRAELAMELIESHWQNAWDESLRVSQGVLEKTIGG